MGQFEFHIAQVGNMIIGQLALFDRVWIKLKTVVLPILDTRKIWQSNAPLVFGEFIFIIIKATENLYALVIAFHFEEKIRN